MTPSKKTSSDKSSFGLKKKELKTSNKKNISKSLQKVVSSSSLKGFEVAEPGKAGMVSKGPKAKKLDETFIKSSADFKIRKKASKVLQHLNDLKLIIPVKSIEALKSVKLVKRSKIIKVSKSPGRGPRRGAGAMVIIEALYPQIVDRLIEEYAQDNVRDYVRKPILKNNGLQQMIYRSFLTEAGKGINFNKQNISFSFFISYLQKLGSLILTNSLQIKTALYFLSKDLKGGSSYSLIVPLIPPLQESKLFVSKVEQKKNEKLQKIRKKAKSLLTESRSSLLFCFVSKKNISFPDLLTSQSFQSLKDSLLKTLKKRKRLLKLILARRLFKRVLVRRLFVHRYNIRKIKKYKRIFLFLRRKKRKMRQLLEAYRRHYAKYKRRIRRRKKKLKRLVLRRNRKKKWRRRNVFRLFRSRYRYRQKFYIPRHFEINYKTGELLYLGFTDSSSLNFRLPFALKLRRLVTHLSS